MNARGGQVLTTEIRRFVFLALILAGAVAAIGAYLYLKGPGGNPRAVRVRLGVTDSAFTDRRPPRVRRRFAGMLEWQKAVEKLYK